MTRKYVAFDIETAADLPAGEFDWHAARPIGVTCAAALCSDADEPILWHGQGSDGHPSPRMTHHEAHVIVDQLLRLVGDGYTILTWNGLAFDFDVLAEEAQAPDVCRNLVMDHVDVMFHVFCELGFRVALNRAAQGMGLPGKPPGMSGQLAPKLWKEARFQEVLDYVAQDVRITLELGRACEERSVFRWKTRKGKISTMPLGQGWLPVRDALKRPQPETSWMTDPARREDFTRWLEQETED